MNIYEILSDKDFKEWNHKIHKEKGRKPRVITHKNFNYDGVGVSYVFFWVSDKGLMRGVYLNTDDAFVQICKETDSLEQIQNYIRKNMSNVDENLLKEAKYFRFMSSHVGEYIGVFDNYEDRNKLFSEAL